MRIDQAIATEDERMATANITLDGRTNARAISHEQPMLEGQGYHQQASAHWFVDVPDPAGMQAPVRLLGPIACTWLNVVRSGDNFTLSQTDCHVPNSLAAPPAPGTTSPTLTIPAAAWLPLMLMLAASGAIRRPKLFP
jgi:hypothetical protein